MGVGGSGVVGEWGKGEYGGSGVGEEGDGGDCCLHVLLTRLAVFPSVVCSTPTQITTFVGVTLRAGASIQTRITVTRV